MKGTGLGGNGNRGEVGLVRRCARPTRPEHQRQGTDGKAWAKPGLCLAKGLKPAAHGVLGKVGRGTVDDDPVLGKEGAPMFCPPPRPRQCLDRLPPGYAP